MADLIHKLVWQVAGHALHAVNACQKTENWKTDQIIRFNTSLDTDNLGDYIIMHYCSDILGKLFKDSEFIDIPTHTLPTAKQEELVPKTDLKFVCGTNLLTSTIEYHWNWILPDGLRRKMKYRNVILLGAGWKNYEVDCSDYSKMIYRAMLNPNVLHSVRDSYTEKMLKSIGILNVINTGCPTMWRLTPEFCRDIPARKAKNVITTVTDYRPNPEADNIMLSILGKNYERVFLWIQGSTDEDYLKKLSLPENLELIPASLDAYEQILNEGDVDYVGTRLHAGIFALNHHVRSLIVVVDNRAEEIAKDTNLPTISRETLKSELGQRICQEWATEIRLKQENIDLFKSQFQRQ